MSYPHRPRYFFVRLLIGALALACASVANFVQSQESVEVVNVWGTAVKANERLNPAPTDVLTQQDIVSINVTSIEDLLKYEPSLIIRQRYIGDTNGTIGARGSNMFQTPRTMVFVDGVPVHYHLQTRWSGAPRWAMVAPNEVGKIDIFYGPYSAEYSGNAMAGVINIETLIPTERSFHVEASSFSQDFSAYGFDDTLTGYKTFMSYGDRIGNFSVYASFNHLENESQPQIFLFDGHDLDPNLTASVTNVNGAISGADDHEIAAIYYGDSGAESATSDYAKLKLGYEWSDWFALLNVVHEARSVDADAANNYITDDVGNAVWSGSVVQDDFTFNVSSRNFALKTFDRESLVVGVRLRGSLTDSWSMEANVSVFDVMKEESEVWDQNPSDPAYTGNSTVTGIDDLGWETAEVKFKNADLAPSVDLELLSGTAYKHYRLAIEDVSGGTTTTTSAFVQAAFVPAENWDASLGLRYEAWQSKGGFFGANEHADRSENQFSPKFSLAYQASETFNLRYSLARAYRFPIVEELFQNQRTANAQSIASIDLKPETGTHYNLMLERLFEQGSMRVNVFYEVVENAIDAQSKIIDNTSVRTFLPLDEVTSKGVEFIFNRRDFADMPLDIRFNVTYAKSEITKNIDAVNNYIGKDFPRLPHWRGNLLATYHLSNKWDLGGGVRYASNSYADADNNDTATSTFGAMDAYTFVNLKTSYKVTDYAKLSFGVDNVANTIAYVHHPWPGRTVFLEGALSF